MCLYMALMTQTLKIGHIEHTLRLRLQPLDPLHRSTVMDLGGRCHISGLLASLTQWLARELGGSELTPPLGIDKFSVDLSLRHNSIISAKLKISSGIICHVPTLSCPYIHDTQPRGFRDHT